MATQSKAQLLNEIHALLKKRYKPKPDRGNGRLTVLESVVYGICHEGTTREQANQALSRFKDGFFDWNEVRVSTVEEIQGALAGLPEPEGRAQKIRRFLRQLFERTYGFTLETLTKKSLKDAIKSIQEYEALESDYVLATVIQQALGGHAIPVDEPAHRALGRLGIAEPDADNATLRSLLERAIPKNRGSEFLDLIEELAHETCVEGIPDCPHCELRKICPTALTRQDHGHAATAGSAKGSRSKESKPAPAKPTKGKPGGSK
jgi:endonuclease-3